ncbi:MAG: hypothetical protein KDA78_20520, partial [Planctomycetaceae bacterium]|nr:hypothetical protein [Planctomycetaceae bacterium]
DMDLAASIQQVTEQILFKMAEHAARVTGQTKLCLAGGVALNCVANGKLLRSGPFEEIWIQPASGDAGGALGAALFVWHQLLNQPRVPQEHSLQGGSLLGPEFTDQQIQDYLKAQQIPFTAFDDQAAFFDEVTQLLEQGMVVGWFQGRMEYGPRALGNRSILADPRRPDMQSILNQKIKFRESFRPFAPAVLEEHVAEQFDWPYQQGSPYMLLVTTVKDKPAKSPEESSSTGFERLKSIRSSLPAITHVDYTARIQTVNKQHNPRFHQLLQTFHQQTGCPVLVNTSFNIRGEPVVCAPQHALACFLGTNMDVLAIGNQIVLKKNIDPARCVDHQQYLDQYQLD